MLVLQKLGKYVAKHVISYRIVFGHQIPSNRICKETILLISRLKQGYSYYKVKKMITTFSIVTRHIVINAYYQDTSLGQYRYYICIKIKSNKSKEFKGYLDIDMDEYLD